MKTTYRLMAAVLLMAAVASAAEMATIRLGAPPASAAGRPAARGRKPPTAYVIETKAAPKIDGQLDEAIWQKAPALRLARTLDGAGGAAQPTTVRLCRDRANLYLAVRCIEPLLGKLRASRRSHDGGIWSDDSVEIFLGYGGQYWHFGINAVGSTYDGKAKDASWNAGPGFKAAAGRGKSQWTLEAAIPVARLARSRELPADWIANFCRNRYTSGTLQEAAWSPTYSGNSHLPERFGRLIFKDPPKAEPKEVVEKESLTILPAAEGEGVVRFDLSALPKKARIHRADLRIFRTAEVDGRFDEALVDVEVYPLFSPFQAGGKAKPSGKPLAVRGPWFDCLNATEAVAKWVSGKTNGVAAPDRPEPRSGGPAFFVKACPFFNAPATCLEIAYEAKPDEVPSQVTEVKALHRSGQTFITFKEITDPVGRDEIAWGQLKMILDDLDRKGELRYVVYRHDKPITSGNLHQTERIATVRPGSAWNLNGRSVERAIDWNLANKYAHMHGHWNPFHDATQDGAWGRDCPMDRLVISDGGKGTPDRHESRSGDPQPLARTTGLYVHTVRQGSRQAGGKAFYAVVTQADGVQNTVDISARNTAGAVTESVAEPEPVLQRQFPPQPFFDYREKRYHYVRWVGPPYVNLPSQYYNWAVAVPEAKPQGKYALELSLHRDDRSYWRTQYRLERDSIVVSPHDFPIPTWWYGYHESLGTLKSFKQGAIHPYTERRLLWFVDWVAKKWPVDRGRINVTSVHRVSGGAAAGGRGGGCSGALHLGIRHPDVFNMALPGHGARPTYAGGAHGSMQRLWGKVAWGLKTDAGTNLWEELDLVKRVAAAPVATDMPLVTFTGRQIPRDVNDFVAAMLDKGHAVITFYDTWSGPKLVPVSATGTWPAPMVRLDVRKNRLMPTFGRSQAGAFRTGQKYSRLNLYYRFSGVVDAPDRCEATVWMTGRGGPATDVTIRRAQKFRVEPGKTYDWKLLAADGKTVVAQGDAAADEAGLLTVPGVKIDAAKRRLVVTAK